MNCYLYSPWDNELKRILSTKVSVLLKIDVTYEMLWYQIKKTKQHQIDFY